MNIKSVAHLFESSGTALGAVKDLQWNEGQQKFVKVQSIGGAVELVPGFQESGEITFYINKPLSVAKTYRLKMLSKAIPIKITHVEGPGGDGFYFVRASQMQA